MRSEIDQTHQVMVVKARGMLSEDDVKMIDIRAVLSGIYDDAILQPAEVSIEDSAEVEAFRTSIEQANTSVLEDMK